MGNQESPSFQDLEPEGQDIGMPESREQAQAFDKGMDDFPEGTLGEYEYEPEYGPGPEFRSGDEEASDEYDLDPEGDAYPRARPTLPDLAARAAFRWGNRASASIPGGNGHRLASAKRSRPSGGLHWEEYLDELGAALLDGEAVEDDTTAWSATLKETYELMGALARAAATARSQAETEGLVAAMVPLSTRLVPYAYRALWPALPALVRGTVGVTRMLCRQPATRQVIEALPDVLRLTVARLARHAIDGRPISRRIASQALARQVAATLRRWPGARPAARRAMRPRRRRMEWWDDDDYGA